MIMLTSPASFDVICAGEALWALAAPPTPAARARFRAAGGAVNAAVALARSGLRVGLAAAVGDDALGRELLAKVTAAGVDVGGVAFAPPRAGLVIVETAGAHRIVPYRTDDEPPIAVPPKWAAQVLLLSGLSPALPHAAGLCKAARSARRAGSVIVVDVNARRHVWAGRDARAIRALLRECDVVRCSTEDLAGLGVDVATLRAAMRESAVLVLTHGAGVARALGPFGEIARAPEALATTDPVGAGDAFTAAVCAELARAGEHQPHRFDLWDRVLRRGHAAARARILRR
jgi:sugar/nucleoside kinase (ribokinase family)